MTTDAPLIDRAPVNPDDVLLYTNGRDLVAASLDGTCLVLPDGRTRPVGAPWADDDDATPADLTAAQWDTLGRLQQAAQAADDARAAAAQAQADARRQADLDHAGRWLLLADRLGVEAAYLSDPQGAALAGANPDQAVVQALRQRNHDRFMRDIRALLRSLTAARHA